jgi:hypothetical protein
MSFVLRRAMDLLHAGGPSLLLIFPLGAISIALAVGNLFRRSRALSRAAVVVASVTLLFAVAGSALNWYAGQRIERELAGDAPFAGRIPDGAKATVLLIDPWSPILCGALCIGLCLCLLRIADRREAAPGDG